MITFENKYAIGQKVFFQTSKDRETGIFRSGKITSIHSTTRVDEGTSIVYTIYDGQNHGWHPIQQESIWTGLRADGAK